jgi:hypothetical protein
MAVTAKLDCIGKDTTGYVAYVQYLDGENIVDTASYRYDPDNEAPFREKVGAKLAAMSESLDAVKAKAEQALTEVMEAATITEVTKK